MKKLIPVFLFLCACGRTEDRLVNSSEFSDIKAFFKAEITGLDSLKPRIVKYSEWNNNRSTDTLIIEDWNEELALFKDFNLPPAVWRTEFEIIDSVEHNGIFTRTFSTVVAEQSIREFSVSVDESGMIQRVEGEIRSNNKLSSSNRKLSYTKNKGYTVAGSRSTKMFPNEKYRIVSQFLTQ